MLLCTYNNDDDDISYVSHTATVKLLMSISLFSKSAVPGCVSLSSYVQISVIFTAEHDS